MENHEANCIKCNMDMHHDRLRFEKALKIAAEALAVAAFLVDANERNKRYAEALSDARFLLRTGLDARRNLRMAEHIDALIGPPLA